MKLTGPPTPTFTPFAPNYSLLEGSFHLKCATNATSPKLVVVRRFISKFVFQYLFLQNYFESLTSYEQGTQKMEKEKPLREDDELVQTSKISRRLPKTGVKTITCHSKTDQLKKK